MELVDLGTSGLRASWIGLGLAALGRPGYLTLGHGSDLDGHRSVDALRQRAFDVLDAASAAGVTYLDAARSYGLAESFLADWLHQRDIGPGERTIGSKWGYTYTAEWEVDVDVHEVKEHSLAALQRQLPATIDLLGAHLDLYQVHSATLDTGVLDDGAVLDALADLRDRGTVIGISTSGPQQAATIERALSLERGGTPLIGCIQATWNVLEPSAGAALRAARAAGVGVIVKEAVANGRLTDRGAADHRRTLAAATSVDATPDATAIAAVRASGVADVVLSGAATVAQLTSNLGATSLADAVDLDRLADLAVDPVDYWQHRSALPWT